MQPQKVYQDHDPRKCYACSLFERAPSYLVRTWPRFRFYRKTFDKYCPWTLTEDYTDEEIVAKHGACLASQNRSAEHLSWEDQKKLFAYIHRPAGQQSINDAKMGLELLETCPFGDKVGILDVDVAKNASPDAPITARAIAVTLLRRAKEDFNATWQAFSTNSRGGIHIDIIGPTGFWNPFLPSAMKMWAENTAKKCNIPLFRSGMGTNKPSEVYLDTSGLSVNTAGRGSIWRLRSGRKPGGQPKTPMDIEG